MVISSVVVAEATPQNGRLDPTDQLVIAWAVDGADSVGSESSLSMVPRLRPFMGRMLAVPARGI